MANNKVRTFLYFNARDGIPDTHTLKNFSLNKWTKDNLVNESFDRRWVESPYPPTTDTNISVGSNTSPFRHIEIVRSSDGTLDDLLWNMENQDIMPGPKTEFWDKFEGANVYRPMVISLGGVSDPTFNPALMELVSKYTKLNRSGRLVMVVPEFADTIFPATLDESMGQNSYGVTYTTKFHGYWGLLASDGVSWVRGTDKSPSVCIVGPHVTVEQIHEVRAISSGVDLMVSIDPPLEGVALEPNSVLHWDIHAQQRAGVVTELRKMLDPKVHVYAGTGKRFEDEKGNLLISIPNTGDVLRLDYTDTPKCPILEEVPGSRSRYGRKYSHLDPKVK